MTRLIGAARELFPEVFYEKSATELIAAMARELGPSEARKIWRRVLRSLPQTPKGAHNPIQDDRLRLLLRSHLAEGKPIAELARLLFDRRLFASQEALAKRLRRLAKTI